MTVSTVKSVQVTALEAVPVALTDRKTGELKVLIDKIEIATTSIDEVGDIVLFAPLPSNAIITGIKIFNDDLDSHATPTLACDVGVYYSGKGGNQYVNGKTSGTVVDANNIATAITTLQAANTLGVDVRFEADDIVNVTKELWDVAGLTTDCGGVLYLGLTMTAVSATPAAGSFVAIVTYI